MQLKKAIKIIGPPQGVKTLIKEFNNTNDIISAVLDQHKLNIKSAEKLAPFFNYDDTRETCRNLWHFVKDLNYIAEPETQNVKSIAKILDDATSHKGNDCKHFAGITAVILDCLKIPFVYRFACYDNSKVPTHVYCVVNDNGTEIIMDSVLPYFDSEKPYTYKIDKKMSLYRLSGVNNTPAIIGNIGPLAHAAAAVSFAPNRAAFLSLIGFNTFQLADKLFLMIYKNESELQNLWYNFGGSYKTLKDTILNSWQNDLSGRGLKPGSYNKGGNGNTSNTNYNPTTGKTTHDAQMQGIDRNDYTVNPDRQPGTIGAVTIAAVTALIVAATPIIVAVVNLFNKHNVPGLPANWNPAGATPYTPPVKTTTKISTIMIGVGLLLLSFISND